MKEVQALSQILSSLNSAGFSSSTSSSAVSLKSEEHNSTKGKYSTVNQSRQIRQVPAWWRWKHTRGLLPLQQLQTHLSQAVPVPGVEGQQAAQLLQTGHLSSNALKIVIDGCLCITREIWQIQKLIKRQKVCLCVLLWEQCWPWAAGG